MDVTAFLSTSAAVHAVAEAFDVPANSSLAIVAPARLTPEQSAWAAALDVARGAVPAIVPGDSDPQLVPQDDPQGSRSLTLLSTLSALSRPQLESYLSRNPHAIADLLAAPPAAADVADWWSGTTASSRAALLSSVPQALGSLEGVPYAVRDAANRSFLSDAVADVTARISDGSSGRAATEQLQAQLHMLDQVAAAVKTGDSGQHRTLISLDVTGGGRAVIAVGDLTTADYVSYLVPGMFYSVDSEIGSWAGAADQLAADQSAWLDRLGQDASVATVAWIGYQTPTVVNIASLDLAEQGRDALTASLRGLDAVRADGSRPYLSILAHSYGATAALLALQQNDVTVDALAMVGSPGSPAHNVGQLKVRGGNVWVADASLDPVSTTGVFGSQPMSAEYGAHRFGVQGATDPITGAALAGSIGHVDYFTAGSESFRNMALIGIGRGALVLDADGSSAAASPRALGGFGLVR